MESILTELQEALTPIATVAFTGFIAWLFTRLRAYFNIKEVDSAEASIRAAAETEAGLLVARLSAGAAASTSPVGLFTPNAIANAAAKVIADLPAETHLAGYTPTDISDMIVSNLPELLGSAAGVVREVIKH